MYAKTNEVKDFASNCMLVRHKKVRYSDNEEVTLQEFCFTDLY